MTNLINVGSPIRLMLSDTPLCFQEESDLYDFRQLVLGQPRIPFCHESKLVPDTGFAPASLTALVSKTSVYTVPPIGLVAGTRVALAYLSEPLMRRLT